MYNNHETQEKNQHLNISDMDFSSELTDDDLNNINGGGLGAAIGGAGGLVAGAGGSILDNFFHGKSIDWKSAAAWGIAGAAGGGGTGAVLGLFGGPVGSALAGD